VANASNSTLSEFCGAVTLNCPSQTPSLNTGDPISPAGDYAGGGLATPIDLAVDSLGHIWMANNGNNSMSEIDSSGLPFHRRQVSRVVDSMARQASPWIVPAISG
jgi:DNA-binding beta-propeller fold protein YncE